MAIEGALAHAVADGERLHRVFVGKRIKTRLQVTIDRGDGAAARYGGGAYRIRHRHRDVGAIAGQGLLAGKLRRKSAPCDRQAYGGPDHRGSFHPATHKTIRPLPFA
ncbi:hypothetical protein RHSP_34803 [Rhizobium freirei PRF 81]|uniref:Uncharacterized protein n=1 Tax=Rhizobium freirei PRF 81 TaxID=363754 RepID=N6U0Q9_9HYPH|nr:hypothetical protein RHSP_34803 [Rhizobium freirei PRF 81]